MSIATFFNPALESLVAQFREELVWAEVLVRRRGEGGFELRHVADRTRPAGELRPIHVEQSRQIAQFTQAGAFRPLKSAPNLARGWCLEACDVAELELALQQFYPGSVADAWAAQSATPPVTSYREFTSRQSGMYRITTKLDDAAAAEVIRVCCHPAFCLKRRRWTVGGLAPDGVEAKCLIPCLEPCAVLLEFARQAVRIHQEEKQSVALAPSEVESLAAALEATLARGDSEGRAGDVAAPSNGRRLRLLLEKLRAMFPPPNEASADD